MERNMKKPTRESAKKLMDENPAAIDEVKLARLRGVVWKVMAGDSWNGMLSVETKI